MKLSRTICKICGCKKSKKGDTCRKCITSQRRSWVKDGPLQTCRVCQQEKTESELCKNTNGNIRNICYKCNNKNRETKNEKYRKQNSLKHRIRLLKKYGVEDIDSFLLTYDKVSECEICCCKFTDNKRIDHCHESGLYRGLICNDCNLGLGRFKDSINILNKAIAYLKLHRLEVP